MNTNIEDAIRTEVEALHERFVGWFTGQLPEAAFETEVLARFDPEFILIPPAGVVLDRDSLGEMLHSAHGSNADFRIAIRNVQLRQKLNGYLLATYEEWQRNALASDPPDNARVASVVFRQTEPLKWLHVQETWLPEAVAAAGPYDF